MTNNDPPNLTIARLQDQLAKRLRFDVLVFFFGVMLGAVLWAWVSGPPINWLDMCPFVEGVQ